jgi:hypothetical protein
VARGPARRVTIVPAVRRFWWVLPSAVAVLGIWSLIAYPWAWAFGIGVHPYPAGTPWTYQLLSGFVPSLTVLSLVTLVAGAWHHVNCHEPGCLRIGKHKVEGTPWCSHHHEAARATTKQQVTLDAIAFRLDRISDQMLTLIEIAAGK